MMSFFIEEIKFGSYTPPDFNLFEKSGYGFFHEAYSALRMLKYLLDCSIKIDLQKNPMVRSADLAIISSQDIVDVYAYWSLSSDMIKRRLNGMSIENLLKHEVLDRKSIKQKKWTPLTFNFSLEQANLRFAELTGMLKAWEMMQSYYINKVLNSQLEGRIQSWEEYIHFAETDSQFFIADEYDYDARKDYNYFCSVRTHMLYAKMAIYHHSLGKELPYFPEFVKKLAELDIRFRKVIKGHHHVQPWADPDLWWHQPE